MRRGSIISLRGIGGQARACYRRRARLRLEAVSKPQPAPDAQKKSPCNEHGDSESDNRWFSKRCCSVGRYVAIAVPGPPGLGFRLGRRLARRAVEELSD